MIAAMLLRPAESVFAARFLATSKRMRLSSSTSTLAASVAGAFSGIHPSAKTRASNDDGASAGRGRSTPRTSAPAPALENKTTDAAPGGAAAPYPFFWDTEPGEHGRPGSGVVVPLLRSPPPPMPEVRAPEPSTEGQDRKRPDEPAEPEHPKSRRAWHPLYKAAMIGATSLVTVAAAPLVAAPLVGYFESDRVAKEMRVAAAATTAVQLRDAQGRVWGFVAQPGSKASYTSAHADTINADFMRSIETLETNSDYFGISPTGILRSARCVIGSGFYHAAQQCGGASTLLMQTATAIRGGKGGRSVAGRKIAELVDAAALSYTYPRHSPERARFIADNLPFGNAGRPIQGLRNASLIIFGVEPEKLSLAQAAILAAAPKRQISLYCGEPTAKTRAAIAQRWHELRTRASYALQKGSSRDPRLASALSEVRAMPDHIHPAPLDSSLTAGMSSVDQCNAAADPIHRTDLIDSSVRSATTSDLARIALAPGEAIEEVRLGTGFERQAGFKDQIHGALHDMETGQQGMWRWGLEDISHVDTVAFSTVEGGLIRDLFLSSPRGLLDEQRRLGSLSKLVGLLAFAASGRGPDSLICNHASAGLQDAGGDQGYRDCNTSGARIPIPTAIGQSLSLAVMDGLRGLTERQLRDAANAAGFIIPPKVDPAYAIAFGLAEASPARAAAVAMAMSRGASGRPAIAEVPHVVEAYRVGGQWRVFQAERVDLRPFFTTSRARTLVTQAGSAALTVQKGTLRALVSAGPVQPFEVTKSGTDAREQMLTYAKTGIGATASTGWFTMIASPRSPLGGSKASSIPLSLVTRRASLH